MLAGRMHFHLGALELVQLLPYRRLQGGGGGGWRGGGGRRAAALVSSSVSTHTSLQKRDAMLSSTWQLFGFQIARFSKI